MLIWSFDRCTASPKDLDQGDSILRREEHTEMLIQAFELGNLWDVYGIVGDVVVHSCSLGDLVSLTFTNISHSTAFHQQLSKG